VRYGAWAGMLISGAVAVVQFPRCPGIGRDTGAAVAHLPRRKRAWGCTAPCSRRARRGERATGRGARRAEGRPRRARGGRRASGACATRRRRWTRWACRPRTWTATPSTRTGARVCGHPVRLVGLHGPLLLPARQPSASPGSHANVRHSRYAITPFAATWQLHSPAGLLAGCATMSANVGARSWALAAGSVGR